MMLMMNRIFDTSSDALTLKKVVWAVLASARESIVLPMWESGDGDEA